MNPTCASETAFNFNRDTILPVLPSADDLRRKLVKRAIRAEANFTVAWAIALLLIASLATF